MRDLPIGTTSRQLDQGSGRHRLVLLAKLLLSAAVLAWLATDLDAARLGEVGARVLPAWLVLAFALKVGSLVLHEVRTWFPLPQPRPPLLETVRLCLGVGLLNLVAPARAGDLGIIAALNQRFGVSLGTATAVVGVTSFLEAAVFGIILLGVLAGSAGGPAGLVGAGTRVPLVPLMVGSALAAVLVVVAATVLGRLSARYQRPGGLLGILHSTLVDTGTLLTSPVVLLRNSGLALVQVGLLVLAFAAGLPAAGLDTVPALAAGSQVLAVSSLASVLLPPSWGVGPAAASKLVLGTYGVPPEEALVYAGVYWLIAHLPFLAIGLPSLWWGRRA